MITDCALDITERRERERTALSLSLALNARGWIMLPFGFYVWLLSFFVVFLRGGWRRGKREREKGCNGMMIVLVFRFYTFVMKCLF